MTIPLTSYSGQGLNEELEATEPDFWLDDVEVLTDGEGEMGGSLPLFDAKTEPARQTLDALHDTLPGAEPPRADPSRERALLAFLETVRRVFGDGHG